MILSVQELIDITAMSLIIGLIFQDTFQPPVRPEDFLRRTATAQRFWWAVALVAPSIILHEFGHKFMALALGLNASFHAAYGWLIMALILKYLLGFVFFVPAYVSISPGPPLAMSVTSFAGPAVNLLLWLGAAVVLRWAPRLTPQKARFLVVFSKINMFLFVFNMLPIPGFDGYHILTGLLH